MIIGKTNYGKPAVTENVTLIMTQFVLLYPKERGYGKKILLSDTLYYLYVIIKKIVFQWFIIQVELPVTSI